MAEPLNIGKRVSVRARISPRMNAMIRQPDNFSERYKAAFREWLLPNLPYVGKVRPLLVSSRQLKRRQATAVFHLEVGFTPIYDSVLDDLRCIPDIQRAFLNRPERVAS